MVGTIFELLVVKKFLGILVLGLFLTSNSFAEVIKYECKSPQWPKLDYVNWEVDVNNKIVNMSSVYDGNFAQDTFTIESIDSEKVFMRSNTIKTYTAYFNYATNQNVHGTSDNKDTVYNCKYNRNLVKDAINKLNSN